jgi:hypothetical protein
LIRPAHAIPSFPEDAIPSKLQIDGLARGLAYWASTYRLVPGNPERHGGLEVEEALGHLPRLDPGKQKGPPAAALNDLSGFAPVVESVAAVTDAEEAISRHTVAFARILVAHPKVPPIPLVHTITARRQRCKICCHTYHPNSAPGFMDICGVSAPQSPQSLRRPRSPAWRLILGLASLRCSRKSLFIARSSMATNTRSR